MFILQTHFLAWLEPLSQLRHFTLNVLKSIKCNKHIDTDEKLNLAKRFMMYILVAKTPTFVNFLSMCVPAAHAGIYRHV